MKSLALFLVFLSSPLLASVSGVYQLSILDVTGSELSIASGFLLEDTNYIVTSYHLLDQYILQADKIVLDLYGEDIELFIVGIDNLHDVMVLEPKNSVLESEEGFELNKCSGLVNVVGFRKGQQFLIPSELKSSRRVKGFASLDTFLPKGFSGAPVLSDDGSSVCGMVVLSNKEDVSSVAVDSCIVSNLLESVGRKMTVAKYRQKVGLEYMVSSNRQLKRVLNKVHGKNIIVNVIGTGTYTLNNGYNVIVNILSKGVRGLLVKNSKNIYVNGFMGKTLVVKDSKSITVVNSVFYGHNNGLILDNSYDMLISNNKFVVLKNGIVLRNIDEADLDTIYLSKNIYKDVKRRVLFLS